jgi:hypothetical protein
MKLIQQIKDAISRNEKKEVFKTFDDLFVEYPGGRPDHFRPINPVDLDLMHTEAAAAGLEPFSKDLHEGGVWFRLP